MARKPAHRPSKLTADVQRRLLYAIKKGATYRIACQYAGIAYQTFLNYKHKAEQGREELEKGTSPDPLTAACIELFDRIGLAEGAAAVQWLNIIDQGASKDPKWAAWKLERRYPDEYGRQRIEVTGAEGAPLKAYVTISPDDWDNEPTNKP